MKTTSFHFLSIMEHCFHEVNDVMAFTSASLLNRITSPSVTIHLYEVTSNIRARYDVTDLWGHMVIIHILGVISKSICFEVIKGSCRKIKIFTILQLCRTGEFAHELMVLHNLEIITIFKSKLLWILCKINLLITDY